MSELVALQDVRNLLCDTCREGYPFTAKSYSSGLFHQVGEYQLKCHASNVSALPRFASPEADAIAAALRELVACKDLAEWLDKNEERDRSMPRNYAAEEKREEYDRRKPLAWETARRLLGPSQP